MLSWHFLFEFIAEFAVPILMPRESNVERAPQGRVRTTSDSENGRSSLLSSGSAGGPPADGFKMPASGRRSQEA
jgi:hypothetical protein